MLDVSVFTLARMAINTLTGGVMSDSTKVVVVRDDGGNVIRKETTEDLGNGVSETTYQEAHSTFFGNVQATDTIGVAKHYPDGTTVYKPK